MKKPEWLKRPIFWRYEVRIGTGASRNGLVLISKHWTHREASKRVDDLNAVVNGHPEAVILKPQIIPRFILQPWHVIALLVIIFAVAISMEIWDWEFPTWFSYSMLAVAAAHQLKLLIKVEKERRRKKKTKTFG